MTGPLNPRDTISKPIRRIDPVESLASELERLVFTAARDWYRSVLIHKDDRDNIVKALRAGKIALTKAKETQ